ncbi:MAG: hypothetical protein H7840_17260 [Alphaproteobacteria bacterium]
MHSHDIEGVHSHDVWNIFIANARMADNIALFHANHKNLAAAGTKLGVDAIGKGVMPKACVPHDPPWPARPGSCECMPSA